MIESVAVTYSSEKEIALLAVAVAEAKRDLDVAKVRLGRKIHEKREAIKLERMVEAIIREGEE